MSSFKTLTALLMGLCLPLAGCNSLLGDFKYDPKGGKSSGGGVQGDIFVDPVDGLVTTEQGAKATFSIVLKRQPTDTVTIALSSSDPAEGSVTPIAVSFTTDNWAAPQMVQVVGVDDDLADGTKEYTVRTSPATSNDESFHNLDPIDPKLKNIDDETAGFTVTPLKGLVTTESGGEATFTVALNRAPTAAVSISLASDNPAEGVPSPEMLTFTPENWMAPQPVTVTGVNDDAADGPQPYKIVTGAASSEDADYNLLDPDDVELINQDNDTAGVTLMPATGLFTSEGGDMTSFNIVLNSPPGKDVLIPLSSSNELEGLVTPPSVLFTPLNWMAPQAVTVTGVDDDRADGNQPYLVLTGPAVSDDEAYANLDGPDAMVTNIDDDSPSLNVTPTMGLVTSETGASATFTVALNSKPRGDVVLDVISSRMEEGSPSPTKLVFTEQNWKAPQEVIVTGQDDDVADSMQHYTVHVRPNPNESADMDYGALLEVDVMLSNTDDDSAGITVSSSGLLATAERGDSTLFTVVLNSQPTADVIIPLTSTDTSEGTVSPARLTFTKDNWSAPQTVTIKGVNDDMADGNQPYRILTEPALSDDPNYAGMNAANVDVINIDDDSPGITVRPNNQTLFTTESGGMATFTVVLNSQPAAEVNIPIASSNAAEGVANPPNLRFTLVNWNAPQTVTVRGVNDDVADGNQPYRVALLPAQSMDPNYNGRDANDINVVNVDNDSAGIQLLGTTGLTTTEGGGMASFQVVLTSKPTSSVQLAVSSSDTTEGTVSPGMLTFTTNNWNAPQTVTITGVNDDVADGNQPYRIITAPAVSQDPNYNGRDPQNPDVINIDNDSPGVMVSYTPASGLTTTEAGGTATFTVVLSSQPTANVTVPLRSTNPKEGTVSPTSLVFTPANWSAPRTVTITGVDDKVADGMQPYWIEVQQATSMDAKYAMLDAPDVPVSNVDDDSAGITVSDVSGNTTEKGGTATFTIVLNSEPKANVSISLTSSNPYEGEVSPETVTFTPLNWSAPQRITITGVDDKIADGAQPYTIETSPAVSDDTSYKGLDPRDISLSNVDDDSAGFTVSEVSGDTSESGATATFTVVLNSQPVANVVIPISSSNPYEGTVSVSSLTFTKMDWAAPKTVTITGVDDDDVADGRQPYSIITGPAVSMDKAYDGLNPPDVAVFNIDNDSAGFVVSAQTGTTAESGPNQEFTFTVALTSKPTANVTVAVSSSKTSEGTVSPPMLVFTPANWSAKQQVTVTGVNDNFADGAQPYTVRLAPAVSMDENYDELDPPDVAMSNTDDDSAGIDVSLAAGNTSEGGGTTTFTIVLRSQPMASVTIPLSSSDTTEGTVTPDEVVFTTENWSSKQTVTVKGVNDDEADGHQQYTIRTGAAISDDPAYNKFNPDDVTVTNTDDDTPGFTITPISGPTSEDGDSATFTIKLSSRPMATVTIPVSSSNLDEGEVDVASVTFTTSNWNVAQVVTVTGVDDNVADGPQEYLVRLGKPSSADAAYAALDPNDVVVINEDNDSAGFMVTPAAGPISESGTSTTFEVSLMSEPTASVTIPLSVSDESEASLAVSSISFTTSNWKTPQQVTVTGVDDDEADGPQDSLVVLGVATSTDPDYGGKNPSDVAIKTLDDDSASLLVSAPSSNMTSEAADSEPVTFTVRLSSAPTATVTIPIASSDPNEGVVTSPPGGELSFNASNWNMPRAVTVEGVDDEAPDGAVEYRVEIGPATSADKQYDGKAAGDISLINVDDDPL